MPNLNKLHDDALRIATGGTRRIVSGSSTGYADVRSGPGEDYDLEYRIFNGNPVYTTSTHRTCGNYDRILIPLSSAFLCLIRRSC